MQIGAQLHNNSTSWQDITAVARTVDAGRPMIRATSVGVYVGTSAGCMPPWMSVIVGDSKAAVVHPSSEGLSSNQLL